MHRLQIPWATVVTIVIYTYFAGLTFLGAFYRHFGWSAGSMDIPLIDVFPFAVNLFAFGIAVGPKLGCLVVLLVLVGVVKMKPSLRAHVPVVILILAVPGVYWIASESGRAIAAEELRQTAGAAPRRPFGYVAATFKPIAFELARGHEGEEPPVDECRRANRAGRLRLVTQTSRSYFTVALPPGASGTSFTACDFNRDAVSIAAGPRPPLGAP